MKKIKFQEHYCLGGDKVNQIRAFVQKLYQKNKAEIDELNEAQSIVSKSTISTGDSYHYGVINYSLCDLLSRIDDICAYNGAPRRFTGLIKNINSALEKAEKVIKKYKNNNSNIYGVGMLYNIWCENEYKHYSSIMETNWALDYITDDSIVSFLASVLPVNN